MQHVCVWGVACMCVCERVSVCTCVRTYMCGGVGEWRGSSWQIMA